MPRFLAVKPDAALIRLSWNTPLEVWSIQHSVALPRGISRHVVCFIQVGDEILTAKEILEEVAVHEYRQLTELRRLGVPSVEPVEAVLGRQTNGHDSLDSILLIRYLPLSLPYRALFYSGVRLDTVNQLLDAMVALFARPHLTSFYWGGVSPLSVLFRRDAGEFTAYLVDAGTGEMHPSLTAGQRTHDLETARTNLFGEFCDLEAGGMLDPSLDPQWLVDTVEERYQSLWVELTGVEELSDSEMYRLEGRVRRLNASGFDVVEIDVQTSSDGRTICMQPKVVEARYHARRLIHLIGLDAEEHQARRLLNDMGTFRVKLPGSTSESVMAHKRLTEVFGPAVTRVPTHPEGKCEPAQLFHGLLDHRWYQPQRENREVSIEKAVTGYIADVLATLPDEHMSNVEPVGQELANKYDPSQGFVDDQYEKPYDPWGDEANDSAIPVTSGFDIDALRAKAARDPRISPLLAGHTSSSPCFM